MVRPSLRFRRVERMTGIEPARLAILPASGFRPDANPSPSLPMVEKAGIEPARQRLQGAPGALPVIPRAAASLIIL
jgi:hypothetical protein